VTILQGHRKEQLYGKMREGRVAAQHSLPCSAVIDERGHLQKVRLSATPLVAQDAARARSSVIPTRPHFLHFCRKSLALGRVIEFCHGPAIESVADCIPSEAGKFTRIAAPYRRFDTATER